MIAAAAEGGGMALLVWTLCHFLWQGAVIGAVYGLTAELTTRPGRRYPAAVVALAACALAPLVTFLVLWVPQGPWAASDGPVMQPAAAAALDGGAALPAPQWIALLWVAGVVLMALRSAAGWWYLRVRVVARAAELDRPWRGRLRRLARRAGVDGAIRVLVSTHVGVPQLVGCLRPVIVLPLAALTGLPATGIEAVMLHELIHLRRRDHWVNLLQNLLEVFLFYHPVVWWLSGELRREREYCCDDEVVAITGRRLDYAKALIELESRRPLAPAAVGLTGGHLMHRIQRILVPAAPRRPVRGGFAAVALAAVLAAAAAPWIVAAQHGDDGRPIPWLPEDVRQWEPLLHEAAERHQVDPGLLAIIALVESGGQPDAVSPRGARGLMQIMPATGAKIAGERGIEGFETEQLMDPAVSADFAAWLLAHHLRTLELDPGQEDAAVEWAAAAYNAGIERVRDHLAGGRALSEETEKYMQTVRGLWQDRHDHASETLDGLRLPRRAESD